MSVEPLELLAQFIIATIVFSISMKFFFPKVLSVLEQRESKTTALAKEADLEMEKYSELKESYEKKLQEIREEVQGGVRRELEKVSQSEGQKYQEESEKISKEIDQKKEREVKEIYAWEQKIFKNADSLAQDLTSKLAGED